MGTDHSITNFYDKATSTIIECPNHVLDIT